MNEPIGTLSQRHRLTLWVLAVIAVTALAARLWGLDWGLPLINEEAYPLKVAWRMWGWGPGRGFDLNPHFFKYPTLTMYLQLVGQGVLYLVLRLTGAIHSTLDFRMLFLTDPTPFYVTGRLITALFGAATVVPTYLLGTRLSGKAAGLAAALLVAINLPLIDKSQVIEVDVPLACLVTTALWLSLRLLEQPSRRAAVTTGVVIGLATAAKYPGALALVPALAALLLAPRRPGAQRTPARTRKERKRVAARPAAQSRRLAHLGLMVPLGIAALAALLVASPFLALDTGSFLKDLGLERQHMQLGHLGSAGGTSWGFYARAWGQLLGWPLAIASLAGLVRGLARRQRGAIVLGSLFALCFAIFGSWSMKADRYLLPLVPAGIVFACTLVDRLVAAVRRYRRAVGIAGWIGALVLFSWAQASQLPEHRLKFQTDTRARAKAWIEAHVPSGSLVMAEQYAPDLLDAQLLSGLDPEEHQALCQRLSRHPIYAVQSVPMFQVVPERSEDFYDLRFFRLADFVVVTGAVRDRYRAEPTRFRRQLALYDSLDTGFIKRFEADQGPGPDIVIYQNPRNRTFAERAALDSIPLLNQRTEVYGGEASYYYSLGLNCEAFGFLDRALKAYEQSVLFGLADRPAMMNACRGIARTLVTRHQPEEALRFLAAQLRQNRPPPEVAGLEELRRDVIDGTLGNPPLLCR